MHEQKEKNAPLFEEINQFPKNNRVFITQRHLSSSFSWSRGKFDQSAAKAAAQPEVLQIAEDMEPEKQQVIFRLVQQAEEEHPDSEKVRRMPYQRVVWATLPICLSTEDLSKL